MGILGLFRAYGDFLVYQLTAGDRMDIQIGSFV